LETRNLFNFRKEPLKLGKTIRLFEAFSGIGTQTMALKKLGVNVQHVGISEIDKYAILSYGLIHGEVKNYGDISKIEQLPPSDICTWSFPCQSLSAAGKQEGMNNGTKSNYGYIFLDVVNRTVVKPTVLLMENVPALVGKKFKDDYENILLRLKNMGYVSYTAVLNAKNYGIPQGRKRVFIVSILGENQYEFPKPILLNKKLKDVLETNVDEKYYLSERLLSFFIENSKNNEAKGNGFRFKPHDIEKSDVAFTITTRAGGRMDDNFIQVTSEKIVWGQSQQINRIRKLTPRECWRLMGVDDEDFDKVDGIISNSQLYKQAGNAIVVDVLVGIFEGLI